jgi:hypothetical protein
MCVVLQVQFSQPVSQAQHGAIATLRQNGLQEGKDGWERWVVFTNFTWFFKVKY